MDNRSEYYDWLMDIIKGPDRYSRVLKDLWDIEFYSIVPNDDNRAADGVELRYYFEDYTGEHCDKRGACTVLEMMIGLAMRMEDDFLYDVTYGDRTYQWFWDMFYCLGLSEFDDFKYDYLAVRDIVFDFLDRAIVDEGGRRSVRTLFPAPTGQRSIIEWNDMEIWWQMNKYILEKFS